MANPLDLRGVRQGDDGSGGKFDPQGLSAYCARMNAMNFVIANGWEYFVNRRTMPDGRIQHYVDRRDCHRSAPPQIARQAARALSAAPDRHPGYADA